MRTATESAARISRALLSASGNSRPTWNPSLEQTLHRLGCRDALSASLVARVIDPFLLNHRSLALGFFDWASQQPGFSHDSVSYLSILKSLSFSRQFGAVEAILKQAKTKRIVLASSVYESVIDSFVLGRKNQNAFWVFDEAMSLGREIGHRVCNLLLAGLASDGCLDYAQKVFDEMSHRSVSLNTVGFGVFIWRFCRNVELGRVLSLVDEVKKADSNVNGSIVALVIVHGLCEASRESDAFWILEDMRKREYKPDFMAYRIVAEAFESTGSLYERQVVLKKKRKLGVAPRSSDYRDFILDLISARRVVEAKELAEVIVSGNFPIDDDVLNVLIGSASAIDPDSAISFINFMIRKGKLPTLLTLSNLSRNLCKHGKSDQLLNVYKVLSSNDYFSDTESYSVMVSFLCKAGKVREAYNVLQEMKKKGWGPDVSLYNSLMEACCRQDLIRPAKRLWDEMFANGCNVNLKTYNILIQKLSDEEADEALRLFHHMLEKEIAPDAMTYTSLLEGLCRETKLEVAFEVFGESVKQDAMLSRSILSTFVLNLCRNGHFVDACTLLCSLTANIAQTDSHVVLLKSLAAAKEVQMGIEHIRWIKETSPSMIHSIASELSTSLSLSSNPNLIFPFLKALQEPYTDVMTDSWKKEGVSSAPADC